MRRVFDEKFKTKSVSMIDEGYSVTEIVVNRKLHQNSCEIGSLNVEQINLNPPRKQSPNSRKK